MIIYKAEVSWPRVASKQDSVDRRVRALAEQRPDGSSIRASQNHQCNRKPNSGGVGQRLSITRALHQVEANPRKYCVV